ncbi:MAG: hypothetical protein KatS3mg076_0815 [Candidatus Binatia bacterium]|nr:MAG: hypothetical protein KatS3mg076_0815 [Candidatus Binatia bacterium]
MAKLYGIVYAVLVLLTGVTVAVAHFDLGAWSVVVALGVATAKALLVAFVFMHLLESPALARAALVVGLLWFGLLVLLTMGDYGTRTYVEVALGGQGSGEPAQRGAQGRLEVGVSVGKAGLE